jgi:hydrogenase maturation protease
VNDGRDRAGRVAPDPARAGRCPRPPGAGVTPAESAPAAASPATGGRPTVDGAPSTMDGVAPTAPPGTRVLLVGIGNELRHDDAAGPRVVRAVQGLVGWDTLVVHGLTPELADDLAAVDLVIFVDANADPFLPRPTWRSHDPPAQGPAAAVLLGHALTVPVLLALTSWLHGRAPRAVTLELPGHAFCIGECLTPRAAQGVATAIEALLRLHAGC